MQFYSDPTRESDPRALPDVEIFYLSYADADALERAELLTDGDGPMFGGWFYQFCFPGCMPESEPFGPFASQQAAIDACREEHTNC